MASDGLTVLVGTTKGAFLLRGDAARRDWEVEGPHCDGWAINHFASDPETGTLWAGAVANGPARGSGAPRMAAPLGNLPD